MFMSLPDPKNPDRCFVTFTLVSTEPEVAESDRQRWERIWDLAVGTTFAEDFPAAETMQRNFHSGVQDHIIFGRNECAIHQFHREVERQLSGK